MRLQEPAAGAAMAALAHVFAVEPGSAEERAALYRRAADLALGVCRSGPWDDLRELAVLARGEALAVATPPEVRRGALAFIAVLEQAQAAHALVDAVVARGGPTPAIEALLAAPAAISIWAIAQRIAADSGSPALEALRDYAVRLAAPTWRRAAEMAPAYPEKDVLSLLPMVTRLPRRLGRDIALRLCEHPDPRVKGVCHALVDTLRPEIPAEAPAGGAPDGGR